MRTEGSARVALAWRRLEAGRLRCATAHGPTGRPWPWTYSYVRLTARDRGLAHDGSIVCDDDQVWRRRCPTMTTASTSTAVITSSSTAVRTSAPTSPASTSRPPASGRAASCAPSSATLGPTPRRLSVRSSPSSEPLRALEAMRTRHRAAGWRTFPAASPRRQTVSRSTFSL